eukprot:g38819.t1
MLAFIGRGIEYKGREVMLQLYKTLVRPHIEYWVQFWSSHYQKDMNALEKVQKRFTRMLPGMGEFSYEERLDRLGLFSLEGRRLRDNLIEVYKIVNDMDRVESMSLFPRVEGSINRGQEVSGGKFKTDVRQAFHAKGDECLECAARGGDGNNTIAAFKKQLDECTNGKGIEAYRSSPKAPRHLEHSLQYESQQGRHTGNQDDFKENQHCSLLRAVKDTFEEAWSFAENMLKQDTAAQKEKNKELPTQ